MTGERKRARVRQPRVRETYEFSREQAFAMIGRSVRAQVEYIGVPVGTIGTVIHAKTIDPANELGKVAIQWDLPELEFPRVDWFCKVEFGQYLKSV